ncbi:hypothetical protein BBP40_006911, partial [Aspergillus hancockii]
MNEDRRESEASQNSLISYRSVDYQQHPSTPEHHGSPQDLHTQGNSPTSISPSRHRVHFGTDLRYVYGDAEAESEDEENPRSRPYRPAQGSVDITDSSRQAHAPRWRSAFYAPP